MSTYTVQVNYTYRVVQKKTGTIEASRFKEKWNESSVHALSNDVWFMSMAVIAIRKKLTPKKSKMMEKFFHLN